MLQDNLHAIHKTLKQNPLSISSEQTKILTEWLTTFPLFEPFKDQPQIDQLISFLEPIQLKSNEVNTLEQGIELCYVVSGSVYIDLETQLYDILKKRVKKDSVTSKEFLVRPFPGKSSVIIGKDATNLIFVLSSKKCRKFINKKLTSKWAQLARIIQRQPLFKYLDKDTLLDIAQTAKILVHPYNSVIYSKGQQALYSYILMQGNIRILSDNVQVTYLSPQQIFGDQQILAGKTQREFKAVCSSQRVKLIRVQKSEVQKALAVLTVLGKQKSVEKYVVSKTDYRRVISLNMKKLFIKQKDIQPRESSREGLPLYKYKRQSVDQFNFSVPDDPEGTAFSSRLIESLKHPGHRTIIRSRDANLSPAGETFYGRRSLEPRNKKYQLLKLPHLPKHE